MCSRVPVRIHACTYWAFQVVLLWTSGCKQVERPTAFAAPCTQKPFAIQTTRCRRREEDMGKVSCAVPALLCRLPQKRRFRLPHLRILCQHLIAM